MKAKYCFANFNNKKLYYSDIGKGEVTIFLLGWLSNIDNFPIENLLDNHKSILKTNRFIFLHLSNHYKSSYSQEAYTVNDYAIELKQFLDLNKIKKVNIVAHSAGGRYAINFTLNYPKMVNKLVLVATAGTSNKKAKDSQVKKAKYYFHKFENINKDHDKILKSTFFNVYGTSFKNDLKKIQNQTLILWGSKDNTIPIKRAKTFNKQIKNSLFYKIKGKGHMIIKDATTFSYIINFLVEDTKVIQKLVTLSKSTTDIKHLNNYKYNYIRVNPTYKSRKLGILFLSKEKINILNKQYLLIAESLHKLCLYLLNNQDLKIKHSLTLTGINFKKLQLKNEKSLFNYARIDSIYDGHTAKIIEFNARRPQMFEEVGWFNEYFYKKKVVSKKSDLTKLIVSSIKLQCDLNNKTVKNVLLISDFEKQSPLSFYSKLKENFANGNIYKLSTKNAAKLINRSVIKDNKLIIDNKVVDLIIIQSLGTGRSSFYYNNGKIKNLNVRKAYYEGLIEISSPLTSSVFGRKQSLELLQNKKIQKLIKLNSDQINAVNILPKSLQLKKIDQINDDYLVKIQGLGSGEGVYYSKDLNDKKISLVKSVIKKNKGNIMLQQKVNLTAVKIYNLKTLKPINAAVSLEPFIVNINGKYKVVDYTLRAIPQKHVRENSKFNPVYNKPNIWFGTVLEY